jgi:putative ABC transport system substrate-binding protein
MAGLRRVLYLYDLNDPYAVALARTYRDAAHRLGLELVEQAVRTQEEAKTALTQVQKGEVDGLLPPPASTSLNIPGLALEAAAQQALPTMFGSAFFLEQGGLASYGPDCYETGRQAARLVDKILKGADPAELPVEVNVKIEFVINLKVAKALGLTIAPEVLYQADRLLR